MGLSRPGRVAGLLLSVLIVVGCTGTRTAPPREGPSRPPVISAPSGPPVYAYSTASGVHLMRGTNTVAEIELDEEDPVTDAEWTADGARFVVATGSRLVSVDVRSGESVEADCTCSSIAVAAGRVFALDRYGGSELAGYDAATLEPGPAVRPRPGTAEGMLGIDGAGEKLVAFQITEEGARPVTDVVVVDPRDGATTSVGGTGDVGVPKEAAYTPRGWHRGPAFAYVANGASGAATGVDSVVWFDPAKPDPQVVTDDEPLRAKSPDVAPEDWSSGREGLWWAEDGTLRVTARTWSCVDGGTAGRPECTDHLPPTQWGFDGTAWSEAGGAELASRRELGDGSVLELGLPAAPGTEDKELTLVGTGDRKVLAGDVRRLWTPSARVSGGPPEDEHQDLAERYAPMVWIARGEKNGPTDAAQFIRDSDLWFDHGKICDDDDPVATDVDEQRLAAGDYHHEAAAQPHPQSEDPLSCNHDDTRSFSSNQWLESSPDGPGGGKGFYLDLADEHRDGDGPAPRSTGSTGPPAPRR
jgi:hypothetical protein